MNPLFSVQTHRQSFTDSLAVVRGESTLSRFIDGSSGPVDVWTSGNFLVVSVTGPLRVPEGTSDEQESCPEVTLENSLNQGLRDY